jgi:hypothetical protein
MGLRRSLCVFGRLALFAERRLSAFVGLALGNVGNLGTHFEYDPFDAASGRQIATGRAPCRHRGHGSQSYADQIVNQRIDIRLPNKLAAFLGQLELQHFGLRRDVGGIGFGGGDSCRSRRKNRM